MVRLIALDHSFEPRLKDGVFPAGRLSVRRGLHGGKPSLEDDMSDDHFPSFSHPISPNVTPRHSFDHKTNESLTAKQKTPKMVEITFSDELKDFVVQCLQRDPAKR